MRPQRKEYEAEKITAAMEKDGMAKELIAAMEMDSAGDSCVACSSCFRATACEFSQCSFCYNDSSDGSEVIPEGEGWLG